MATLPVRRRWKAHTQNFAFETPDRALKRVCVVGAGVAALTSARRLRKHGFEVEVFGYCGKNEDGTGNKLGGRLYTEVWDLNGHKMKGPWKVTTSAPDERTTVRFEAGCQWFTASDSRFKAELADWQEAGAVQEWGATFGALGSDGVIRHIASEDLPQIFCGTGGMKQIIEFLTAEVGAEHVRYHIAQRFVPGKNRKYRLEYEEILKASSYLDFVGGNLPQETSRKVSTDEFDYIVLAHGLATNQPRMVSFEDAGAQTVMDSLRRNVRFQNILTLTLVFKALLPLDCDVLALEGGFEVALCVHTSSKKGMSNTSGKDVWTIFSSPEFAQQHALPKQKNEALRKMQEAFLAVLKSLGCRTTLESFISTPFGLLWPHGRCTTCPPSPARALFSAQHGVGVCADYCAGAPCVEAAVCSALEVADAIALHDLGQDLPHSILTDFTTQWKPIDHEIPWVIAHYPGLPAPPFLKSPVQIPVSEYCCPTHDRLGSHPGLVFGRSAALGPAGRVPGERQNQKQSRCAECRRFCELFVDKSDGKHYCAPCWKLYYGEPPA